MNELIVHAIALKYRTKHESQFRFHPIDQSVLTSLRAVAAICLCAEVGNSSQINEFIIK